MRLTTRGERLIIDDTPLGAWCMGLICVVSGLFVLALPLLVDEWSTWPLRDRALILLLIGVPFLGSGLLLIRLHAATRTVLDRATGEGTHTLRRPGTRGARVSRFALADARAVDLVRTRDDDGDAMFQLRLWLAGSRSLLLQDRAVHGEELANERAETIRRFLGLAAPSA